jgi:nitrogen fixation NifU-like protein
VSTLNPAGAPEPDFDDLYREVILEHYHEPRGKEPLAHTDVEAEGMNPLCGDELDLMIQLGDDGSIEGLHVDGRGCAISVASGSILHDLVDGVSLAEARRLLAAVKAVMHGGEMPADIDLGDFDSLEGVKLFPVRIKCALLPWTTLENALVDAEKIVAARASEGDTA